MTSSSKVTIESADVSIRVVHVADKPMTISVYNQLPQDHMVKDSDTFIGWIKRCPNDCASACGDGRFRRHVLVARDGEPVLVRLHIEQAWEVNKDQNETVGYMKDLRVEIASYEKTLAEPFRAPYRRGENDAEYEVLVAQSQARFDEKKARLQQKREEKINEWEESNDELTETPSRYKQQVEWWNKHVAPLPQLYIAR